MPPKTLIMVLILPGCAARTPPRSGPFRRPSGCWGLNRSNLTNSRLFLMISLRFSHGNAFFVGIFYVLRVILGVWGKKMEFSVDFNEKKRFFGKKGRFSNENHWFWPEIGPPWGGSKKAISNENPKLNRFLGPFLGVEKSRFWPQKSPHTPGLTRVTPEGWYGGVPFLHFFICDPTQFSLEIPLAVTQKKSWASTARKLGPFWAQKRPFLGQKTGFLGQKTGFLTPPRGAPGGAPGGPWGGPWGVDLGPWGVDFRPWGADFGPGGPNFGPLGQKNSIFFKNWPSKSDFLLKKRKIMIFFSKK